MKKLTALVVCVLFFACSTVQAQDYAFVPAFKNLSFERPLFLTYIPDEPNRLLVVEQAGRVLSFENRADVTGNGVRVVIDIRGDKVLRKGNEEGLLGLAFHPDFTNNRYVYLHYSTKSPRRNIVSRWTLSKDTGKIALDSEHILLEVEQPFSNHNGGHIEFGPDGFLYIALGDGGAGGDPHDNGQNLSTLLGTILRIDVDNPQDGKAYGIPADNPFINTPGSPDARPEIYAYGLRNVWRFSFDPETGTLWAGDVGQVSKEEIDIVTAGGNYGWRPREGFSPYNGGEKTDDMIDPIVDHNRKEAASITGGYVYHGNALPQLKGAYIYGDYVTGIIWRLHYDGKKVTGLEEIGNVPEIASFGVDADGEHYICSLPGKIYKLTPK